VTHRVLFVESDAPSFLMHRRATAEGVRRAGCDVHLAAPAAPERERIERLGFTFHEVPFARGSIRPWDEAATLRALHALYADLAPDLVHHVALKAVLYGTWAARLARVPAVVNAVTGLGYLFTEGSARAALLRSVFVGVAWPALAFANAYTTFENGDDLAAFERLRLVPPGRGVLVRGTGIDTQAFQPTPLPDGKPVVTLATRMLWEKGVGTFVEAARLLRAAGSEARLVLVGMPDPENPGTVTREQLQAWHETGVVEWWGFRADMPRVLAESSVVVLPTMYREGVPRILIEAAACGRPAVTTDRPGCRDIVRDGENGILVPPGDPAALAAALTRLRAGRGVRERMGARGRALVEREFAQEHVVAATLDVYARLLPGFGLGGAASSASALE
jgi:glycosyltransferase involved in cell wall biosynthesis